MNTKRPYGVNLLPMAAIVSVYALCAGMSGTAYAQQNVNITVTATAQQKFEGFGINLSNPFGELLASGCRKGRRGTLSAQIYGANLSIGGTTPGRRAQTAIGWVRWMMSLTASD